jgi:hypothetical protein
MSTSADITIEEDVSLNTYEECGGGVPPGAKGEGPYRLFRHPFIVAKRHSPHMDATELCIGLKVRYPRTGTEGNVEKIDMIDGELFASIDKTHLFYRIDQLIPLETLKVKREGVDEDIEAILRKDKVTSEELQEAFRSWDGECGG